MISQIIHIAVAVIVFLYVSDLEKDNCACSDTWKRDYVKYGSIVALVFSVLLLLISLTSKQNILNNNVMRPLLIVINLYLFSYVLVSIIYFVELSKKLKCDCSKNWKRYGLVMPLILLLAGVLIGITLGIVCKIIGHKKCIVLLNKLGFVTKKENSLSKNNMNKIKKIIKNQRSKVKK